MAQQLHGLFVDTQSREIKEVEVKRGTIDRILGCQRPERLMVDLSNDIWIDNNGENVGENSIFIWKNKLLAGNAIILGHNGRGVTTDTALSIDTIEQLLIFTNMKVSDLK